MVVSPSRVLPSGDDERATPEEPAGSILGPGSSARSSRRLSAGQRRRQLLEVALRLFATKGYTATTMDDIADAAGVTKPLLYQHFDSKRALYVELVDTVATTMRQAIESATAAATTPRQQVAGGFSAYFDLVISHADAFRLLFGPTGPEDQETADLLRHVEDQMAEAVGSLIDAGLDDDHRRLLAYAVVGMAEGASRFLLTHGLPEEAPVDAGRPDAAAAITARLASRLADLAWAGLRSVHRD